MATTTQTYTKTLNSIIKSDMNLIEQAAQNRQQYDSVISAFKELNLDQSRKSPSQFKPIQVPPSFTTQTYTQTFNPITKTDVDQWLRENGIQNRQQYDSVVDFKELNLDQSRKSTSQFKLIQVPPSFKRVSKSLKLNRIDFDPKCGDFIALKPVLNLSHASQLMTKVNTWRNLDGVEENWKGNQYFWTEPRKVSVLTYTKALAAAPCYPLIAIIAVVESMWYKILSLFGDELATELFKSSSFTIRWSLSGAGMIGNLLLTNLYTDELIARKHPFKKMWSRKTAPHKL